MEYSVEKLAKMSGVTVRTLHYYDEIGLLTPFMRLGNGRRYYGIEELLTLQEILYFKEIGLSLKKIQSILSLKNLSKVSLLATQKETIIKDIKRLKKIITSIDRTIEHYKGSKMDHKEVCAQFEKFESNLDKLEKWGEEQIGKIGIDQNKKVFDDMNEKERHIYAEKTKMNLRKIIEALKTELSADSEEVQELMRETFNLYLTPPTKEIYEIGRQALLDEELTYFYVQLHPGLPQFLYKAMEVFAINHFES